MQYFDLVKSGLGRSVHQSMQERNSQFTRYFYLSVTFKTSEMIQYAALMNSEKNYLSI